MLGQLNRLLAPLRNRVLSMVARAVILQATEEEGLRRLMLGILAGETNDNAEIIQHYGFASQPLRGCEAVVLHVGGDRSFAMVVATDDPRYRPLKLQPGEVVIYGSADRLAEGEEAPEWLEAPEDGTPAQGMCRISLIPEEREIKISCGKFTMEVNGVPSQISAEGTQGGIFEDLAQVGRDVVVIDHGDSQGVYVIQRGGEGGNG
ncbi:MAG: phage baseplate assembly protein [Desulfarculus sp.]|nr:phage baseplate assembly protein [Desulfarculus sp.]